MSAMVGTSGQKQQPVSVNTEEAGRSFYTLGCREQARWEGSAVAHTFAESQTRI